MTIVSEPNEINFLNANALAFGINAGTVITDTSRISLGYRLVMVGVGPVTPDLAYFPQNNEFFRIGFDRDIAKVLTAVDVPSPFTPVGAFEEVPGMVGKFVLQYWEVTFTQGEDGLFCDQEIGAESETDPFFVVNASYSFDQPVLNTDLPLVLTQYPKELPIAYSDTCLVYILTNTAVSIRRLRFNLDGTNIGQDDYNYSAPSEYKVVAINVNNAVAPPYYTTTVAYSQIQIRTGGATFFEFVIKPFHHNVSINLMFQTKLGGLATVPSYRTDLFNIKSSDTIFRTGQNILRPTLSGADLDANVNAYDGFNVLIDARQVNYGFTNSPRKLDEYFYRQFMASGLYYMLHKNINEDAGGTDYMAVRCTDFSYDSEAQVITLKVVPAFKHQQPNYYA